MTSEQERRRDAILESILALTPEQRPAYLAEACTDEQVREEIERLIQVRGDMDAEFLESAAGRPILPELERGRKVGRYFVEELIGHGGMSFVYRAHDDVIGRRVALKVIAISGVDAVELRRRFLAELKILGSLKHDNIVHVYDFGDVDGAPFMVMELLEGEDLSRAIKAGRAGTTEQKIVIARQIATALQHIHEAGILHRDVKPANVFLELAGRVKLMDFGIARSFGNDLKNSNTFAGTLEYMSPEQIRGEKTTPRTDIYSFGILLYELFTGKSPFSGKTIAQMVRSILEEPVPRDPLPRAGVPVRIARLIRSATAKEPTRRPADFTSVLKLLRSSPRSKEPVHASAGLVVTSHSDAFGKEIPDEPGTISPTGPEEHPPLDHLLVRVVKKETGPGQRNTVGRAKERSELMSGFDSALAGRGMMWCVAGEAGMGKTTLVEDFLAELAGKKRCTVLRGRCSERLAGTESYLPVLEAVESLLRDGTNSAGSLVRQVAPAWYVQVVPSTSDSEESSRFLMEAKSASAQRLKREFASLLCELSRTRPLVLFIDDLQWADVSTIDLLSFLASKFEALPVLILIAYRPSDLLLQKHPFLQIKRDLQARGSCRELMLDFLSQADIGQYVGLEFPGHRFPAEFPVLIHVRTEGSPLFMADLLRYLRDRGVIAVSEHAWTLAQNLLDMDRELPESVRGMIERKIAQLDEEQVKLLSVASVQGYEFDSAVIARVLARPADEVEERLEQLQRIYAFVKLLKEREFPDGTLTLRYRFVHVLYQNAFYDSLRATRKTALSRDVARAVEECYGGQNASVASELAALYEAGREYSRAAEYFRMAAHQKSQLFASQEAVVLARRGLRLLEHVPQSRERDEREAALQIALGNAMMATRGYADPEVGEVYTRAHDLSVQIGNAPHLLPALHGLYTFHVTNGNLSKSLELGRIFLEVAEPGDPARLVAHRIVGCTHFCMGDLGKAREHFEQLTSVYDPARHRSLTWLYGNDPGMIGRMWLAWTLWLQGFPDQALHQTEEGLRLGKEVPHANSLAYALDFAAWSYQYRGEWRPALEMAERAITLSSEQGLKMWLAWGIILRGRAWVEQGDTADGIGEIVRGMEMSHATGAQVFRPQQCCQLVSAYARAHQPEKGLAALDEAQSIIDRTRELYWQPDVFRLRGDLLVMQGAESEAAPHYLRALESARELGAKSLELRAATSFARLLRESGKRDEARQMLSGVYGWFTEGFDTADLKEAKALLAELY